MGLLVGRHLCRPVGHLARALRRPEVALLGVVGLILAFGLARAVGCYETRRAAVVQEANAIGTTYLRAQTLAEPFRTGSRERLVRYTGTSIRLSRSGLATLLLLVTFDLDRPTRGMIRVPAAPLTDLRASMDLPPAATDRG